MLKRFLMMMAVPLALIGCGASQQNSNTEQSFNISAQLISEPAKVGMLNGMRVTVTDLSNQPLTGAQVSVKAQMPAHGHGPPTITAQEKGAGTYEAAPLTFNMVGEWVVTIRVTQSGKEAQTSVSYTAN